MPKTEHKIAIPDQIKYLAELFKENGYSIHIVGGYVRDAIHGHTDLDDTDIDICGDCLPDEFVSIALKSPRIDIKDANYPLGTIKLFVDSIELEYTCYRTESYRGLGAHTPDRVVFTTDIIADATRRDFTINSIYLDPISSDIYDPFDGIGDIISHTIRTNRDSELVFAEDALRLLRMCRFAGKMGYQIDASTLSGAIACSHMIHSISTERIGDEIDRIVMTQHMDYATNALFDSKLAQHICPNIKKQTMLLAHNAPSITLVRWAIILHDIPTDTAKSYIKSLHLGKSFANNIAVLLDSISICAMPENTAIVALAKLGYQYTEYLLYLLKTIKHKQYHRIEDIVSKMSKANQFIHINSIAVNGHDIIDILGVDNRQISAIKDEIYVYLVHNPSKNTYEDIKQFLIESYIA